MSPISHSNQRPHIQNSFYVCFHVDGQIYKKRLDGENVQDCPMHISAHLGQLATLIGYVAVTDVVSDSDVFVSKNYKHQIYFKMDIRCR